MPMNIAIDGPVGAGKSSIADQVAAKLNILHLDTGAMYRTFGLYALRSGADMTSEEELSRLVEKVQVNVLYENGAQRTLLFDEDVTDLIRSGERGLQMAGGAPPHGARAAGAGADGGYADRRPRYRHGGFEGLPVQDLPDRICGGARAQAL